MPDSEKSHTRRWSAGTSKMSSSLRVAPSGSGTSNRPTLVETTNSSRGRVRSISPSRRSERPSP